MLMLVTETGEGPRLAAKYRPSVPIVACCSSEATARACALLRGVIPIVIPWNAAGMTGVDGMSELVTVSVKKVIQVALGKVRDMGIVRGGRALVLHDSDICDGEEMSDWVLRIVDLAGLSLPDETGRFA